MKKWSSRLFATVDWRRISWVSLGVLRNTPGLEADHEREAAPQTRLLAGEQVPNPDGKLRYFQPLRIEMYRKMLQLDSPQRANGQSLSLHGIQARVGAGLRLCAVCEKELGAQLDPASV